MTPEPERSVRTLELYQQWAAKLREAKDVTAVMSLEAALVAGPGGPALVDMFRAPQAHMHRLRPVVEREVGRQAGRRFLR